MSRFLMENMWDKKWRIKNNMPILELSKKKKKKKRDTHF